MAASANRLRFPIGFPNLPPIPMADTQRSSRLFVTRKLPWVLAGLATLVYWLTLNHWIGLQNLRPVVEAAGWSFEFPFSQPLHGILAGILARLTGPAFPLVANALTALVAGWVLYLLARTVALLPHDRRHEERIRESSDIALLTIPFAWVPPVLATLLLAFQYQFWLHATSYTREMLDLLVFAWAIRNLVEYRLDGRERRLQLFSLLVGVGIADNWAMIGFAPLMLLALMWVRGMEFFNLGFLVRILGAFALGLSLLLFIPFLAKAGSRVDESYWSLLSSSLGLKAGALLSLPRSRFLILALLMLLPLAAFGIRWGTPSGTGIDRLVTTLVWQLLKFVWFVASIVLAFDVAISPRNLAYGVPLLTFSYCASIVAGYVAGYYLLVGTTQPPERQGSDLGALGRGVFRALAGAVVLAAVAVPLALFQRNFAVVRSENGPGVADLARTLLAPVGRLDRALVYSDDPALGTILVAANASLGGPKGLLVVNGRLAPSLDYRRFLASRHGDQWPALRNLATAKENVAGQWLGLTLEAARGHQMFFATPIFSFFAEPFDFRPLGSLHGALPRQGLLEVPAVSQEIEGLRGFWSEVAPSVEAVIRDRSLGSSNAVALSALWSRSANASGVFFQRAGQLGDAVKAFDLALRLNPANAAAKANRLVNEALGARKPIPQEAVKAWDGQVGLLDLHGPVDEPEFLRIFGSTLLAQKDDLIRRAAISFDRAAFLAPTNLLNRFGFVTAALTIGDIPSATNALVALRRDAASGHWSEFEMARLFEAEGRLRIAVGDTAGAEAPFVESRRRVPTNPEIHDLLSYLYLVQGRGDDALEATVQWEKVAAPGDQSPLVRRSIILLQGRRYPAAAETLTRILEVSPENALARVNRAIARLMQNQLAEAKADYTRLIKDGADSFQVRFGLAEVARLEKEPSEELKHLERYLQMAPSSTAEYTNAVQRAASLRSGR